MIPPQLLIINPNTSAEITTLLHENAQRLAGPAVRVRAVTARFGAPYIACEASFAVAAHATLDAWAAALSNEINDIRDASDASVAPAPDAVLIGCFGDPGLSALREASSVPVTGLAEAAFTEAAQHGRFAIVTGGARWQPMLQRLSCELNFGERLAGIHTVSQTGIWLAAHPVEAKKLLADACQQAAQRFGAQAVIVGGAGLAGMADLIAGQVGVPLIDSVQAGIRHSLACLGQPGVGQARFDVNWQNVSAELAARGQPGS
jgi:allantoin racemase